jgi:hypothetical protein
MASKNNDPAPPARLRREMRTIAAMIRLYCKKNHPHQGGMCRECQALLDYAANRLERCPFRGNKPTCARCPIHCYQPERRAQIRQVMRFAGPWMAIYHPYLMLRHYLDEWFIPPPSRPKQVR